MGDIPDSHLLGLAPFAPGSVLLLRVTEERGGAEEEEWSRTGHGDVNATALLEHEVGNSPAEYSTVNGHKYKHVLG